MELSSPSNGSAPASVQSSRRKSGRAVQKPEVLNPSFASRRRAASTSDAEQDVDMDDISSGADADSDGEPDEQELLEQRRRSRKRPSTGKTSAPAKKTKTSGASTNLVMRPAPKKVKKSKKATMVPMPEIENAEVGTLYRRVFEDDADIAKVVEDWYQRFKADEAQSVAEIVNFVLECAGCYIKVNQHDIDDVDNCTSKLTDIQEEFQATKVSEYPLIKQRTSLTFRRSLSRFVDIFIQTLAQTGTLIESPELLENLQAWLTPMSSAASRPIRHTATVISLDFTSAFCSLGRSFVNRQAKLNRQADGEEKNKKVNKARVQDLKQQAGQTGERITEINNFIRDWFDTVFVHRYRDVDPHVRVDCIRYLGEWLIAYPEHFLDGAHLRYLGWLLSDTNPPTRQEAIKQLHRMYKDDTKLAALRQFTERFRVRMIEIASQDAELGARVLCIELLDVLREKGFLEPDDVDNLGKLIYDTEPRIRKAILPFFSASVLETYQLKIEELGEESLEEYLPEELSEEDFERPQRSWLKFKSLAELLQAYDSGKSNTKSNESRSGLADLLKASGIESRFSSVAKVLSGSLEFVNDWQAVAGYLLYDHSSTSDEGGSQGQVNAQYKLNESEEILLLHVLNSSVRGALASVVEETAASKKIKKSKKELESLEERRDVATQQLAVIMPKLLTKFNAIAEAAAAVLQLARTLNLEVFHQLRQESTTYAKLLDDINKQFLDHEDRDVLDEATAAMLYSKGFEDLEDVTEAKLASLWNDTAHKFVVFCRGEDVEVRGSMQDTMLAALTSTTFRLSKLASISNPTDILEKARSAASSTSKSRKRQSTQQATFVPIGLLLQLLARGVPNSGFSNQMNAKEDELVGYVLQTLFFYFLWNVQSSKQKNKTNPGAEAGEDSQARREEFTSRLRTIVKSRRGADHLRLAATRTLLDVETMFASTDVRRKQDASRGRLPSTEQSLILRVFVAAERAHALKSSLTRERPGTDEEPSASSGSGSDLSDVDDTDGSPMSSDAEEGDAANAKDGKAAQRLAQKKHRVALLAEEAFCDLSGRMALAIIAGVLSSSSPDEGDAKALDVRNRFVRNRNRLGKNFKTLVTQFEAALAEKQGKGVRSGKAKAGATLPVRPAETTNGEAIKANPKSAAIVADDLSANVASQVDGEDEARENNEGADGLEDGAQDIDDADTRADRATTEVESVVDD
ncbi:MAG: hypothetical protein M1828_003757 [Chrysothrix sp. TS-e1954]|nr:MAG: hypothetical protein M1828_003757 [Chrysothrix sp. TS-e1954]